MIANKSTSQESNLRTAGSPATPSYQEILWLVEKAQHLRRQTIAAGLRRAASALGRLVRTSADLLAQRRKAARAMRHLSQMDDRLLADIGLTRGDIQRAVLFGTERSWGYIDISATPVQQLRPGVSATPVNDSGDHRKVA